MLRPSFEIFAQQYLSTILSNFGKVYLNEPIPRDAKMRIYKLPSRLGWRTDYLTAITAGNNRVMVSPEVTGEAELVDVLFEPDTDKSRESLGLLGELTSVPCIIENLRSSPDIWALQNRLKHWLTWKAEDNGSIIPIHETPIYLDDDDDDYDDDEESDIEDEEEEEEVDKTLDIKHPHDTEVRQQLRQWYRLLLQGQMGKESKRLMETLAIVDEFNEAYK